MLKNSVFQQGGIPISWYFTCMYDCCVMTMFINIQNFENGYRDAKTISIVYCELNWNRQRKLCHLILNLCLRLTLYFYRLQVDLIGKMVCNELESKFKLKNYAFNVEYFNKWYMCIASWATLIISFLMIFISTTFQKLLTRRRTITLVCKGNFIL